MQPSEPPAAPLAPTPRTTLRRLPRRGSYDRTVIHGILDEALVCHVGFAVAHQPYVIPTTFGRIGDDLYIHGAAASRMLKALSTGIPVCVTVTLLDGLVLARSAFHHSMNYRSVVILGVATPVTDPAEIDAALRAIVEHVAPGRSGDVRGPNDKELRATSVLRLRVEEASAKVRTGPPIDDAEDMGLSCWAGELPLRVAAGAPVPDPALPSDAVPPENVRAYTRPGWPR